MSFKAVLCLKSNLPITVCISSADYQICLNQKVLRCNHSIGDHGIIRTSAFNHCLSASYLHCVRLIYFPSAGILKIVFQQHADTCLWYLPSRFFRFCCFLFCLFLGLLLWRFFRLCLWLFLRYLLRHFLWWFLWLVRFFLHLGFPIRKHTASAFLLRGLRLYLFRQYFLWQRLSRLLLLRFWTICQYLYRHTSRQKRCSQCNT